MWWIWSIGTPHKTWLLSLQNICITCICHSEVIDCNFNSACSQLVETLDALVAIDALLIQCEPAMLCNVQGIQQKHCLPKYRNAKESFNPSPETKRSSLTQEENFLPVQPAVSVEEEWMDVVSWILPPDTRIYSKMYLSGFPDARCLFSWSMTNDRHLGFDWSTLVRQISHVFISSISSLHQILEQKRHFCISLWIYPCPSVRNVHMKLQFDWTWPYRLASSRVSTAILVNLFDFHSRAQCQKWWQNCLRTFPWKLKFSVNLSHIQSSGNFQRNPRVMMGIAMK